MADKPSFVDVPVMSRWTSPVAPLGTLHPDPLRLCLCLCLCLSGRRVSVMELQELRATSDTAETLRALGELRVEPVTRRELAVDLLLQAALDSETPAGRADVRTVLAGLVPSGVADAGMVTRGVAGTLELFDDIVIDYPKAADYFAEVLRGVVVGTSSGAAGSAGAVVPATALPPMIAKKMGLAVAAPAPAPAAAAASATAPPGAEPAAPTAAAPTPAPAPAAASEPTPQSAPPAAEAAAAPAADEGAGKKKKKKGFTLAEE